MTFVHKVLSYHFLTLLTSKLPPSVSKIFCDRNTQKDTKNVVNRKVRALENARVKNERLLYYAISWLKKLIIYSHYLTYITISCFPQINTKLNASCTFMKSITFFFYTSTLTYLNTHSDMYHF